MDLNKKLSFLVSNPSSFDNPFDDNIPMEMEKKNEPEIEESDEEITMDTLSIDYYLNKSKEKIPKKKKKKDLFSDLDDIDIIPVSNGRNKVTKKSKAEQVLEDMDRLSELELAELGDEFDEFLDSAYFEEDENIELKNSLISLGRKYTRDTATSAESSEIQKAFSGAEKRLNELYEELNKDKDSIQKDIDQMRLARTRNFKSLAELIETKNASIQAQLNIIKELNGIRKSQFDLKFKEDKNKTDNELENSISNNAIRNLFSMGKSDMLNSLGGYEGISGAIREDDDNGTSLDYLYDDEVIQKKYFSDNNTESDGDKFLRYEGMNIDYILMVDDSNNVQEILAENDEGELIPDYPMPTNINSLTFQIDSKTMTAEDDLHRKYLVRRV